jgi:hypothetical protein
MEIELYPDNWNKEEGFSQSWSCLNSEEMKEVIV